MISSMMLLLLLLSTILLRAALVARMRSRIGGGMCNRTAAATSAAPRPASAATTCRSSSTPTRTPRCTCATPTTFCLLATAVGFVKCHCQRLLPTTAIVSKSRAPRPRQGVNLEQQQACNIRCSTDVAQPVAGANPAQRDKDHFKRRVGRHVVLRQIDDDVVQRCALHFGVPVTAYEGVLDAHDTVLRLT